MFSLKAVACSVSKMLRNVRKVKVNVFKQTKSHRHSLLSQKRTKSSHIILDFGFKTYSSRFKIMNNLSKLLPFFFQFDLLHSAQSV